MMGDGLGAAVVAGVSKLAAKTNDRGLDLWGDGAGAGSWSPGTWR